MQLGRTLQYPGEDLDAYFKHFHERALDYYDLVAEDMLVDVCLHGMIEGYHVHLEMFSFSYVSRLKEAKERLTNP